MKSLMILFIVTSHNMLGDTNEPTGVWFEELATPYYALVDAGYDVHIASIKGGEIPIDPRSKEAAGKNPPSVERFLKDANAMEKITASTAVNTVDAKQYAAIFLPGGHGTMWDYPNNDTLAKIVAKTLEEGRIVAAVCHGPAGLVSAKNAQGESIIKGKKVTGFTNAEEAAVALTDKVPFLLETRLKELGAEYSSIGNFEPYAVQDDNLITGQNPASSQAVAQKIIDTLKR